MSSCDSYSFKSSDKLSVFDKTDNAKKSVNVDQKSEFGKYEETYNWVECESMQFPGKPYFFNLRTQNTTWIRPVSRHVQLQRFSRKSKIFDDNSTPEKEIPLILSSESEKDDWEYIDNEENNQSNKEIYKNSEILARLYYGTKLNQFSNNDETLYFHDYFNYFVENLSNKDSQGSHEVAEEETVCDKSALENSPIIISNFLDVELSVSEDALNIKENIEPSNEDNISLIEKPIIYSTSSSDEEKKENNMRENYIVPRLKKIKPLCLLKKSFKNAKRKKVAKKRIPLQEKKLQEVKIVREMYGTTTISYDPVEPELPPGVRKRNLSDSSSEEENVRSVWNNSKLFNIDSYVANLSSKSSSSSSSNSSSSSSCSCTCSCCSSSSTTSKTSKH
ncbi:uncharacterized protein LOC117607297 [Osmia lignaria lignaria]|uniref:uncharacterized protein LOC117607297 n=1 Tax=Osmia lignaria lignaria TaxID=1437193 RepID=UPI001478DFB9|nr:hybrid signal transduction histidine kinase G-like [Osmia lignaria]